MKTKMLKTTNRGGELLPALVKEARKSEIEYFRSMGVYDKLPIQ